MSGPLAGIRVVELGALGPAPFAAMILADLGAEVLRIERPDRVSIVPSDVGSEVTARWDLLARGRRCAAIDMKDPRGVAVVLELAESADVVIEGFRPGVAERLGVGPDVLTGVNDRLVVGRMTGWGRSGPWADRPGHDINYLARSGVLAHIGRRGQLPTPPLNLVADFGGGGMLLAMGICAALVERASSGRGQVVDTAMVDGSALLMTPLFSAAATGFWSDERGTNLLDSGAPFYDCYATSDGGVVAVGAIEPRFYEALVVGLGLADVIDLSAQHDSSSWEATRSAFASAFAGGSRADWEAWTANHPDACVSVVLTMTEATHDEHLRQWGTMVDVDGAVQPAPAPRFSRSDPGLPGRPHLVGEDTFDALVDWGIERDTVEELMVAGVLAGPT